MIPRAQRTIQRTTVVGLFYASSVVVWASYSMLIVSLPFRFQDLGLSVVQYGVAVGALALGMLVTESLWGALAFRIGNLWTVLALGVGVALVYVAIDLSTSFLALTASLTAFGALVIFPVPLFRWMALSAGGPGTEGKGTGRYGLFFGAGMVVGSAVGPLFYVAIGFGWLMTVVLATYAVGLALMAALPWREAWLPRTETGTLSKMRGVLKSPFLFAACFAVLVYVAFTLVANFLQIYSVSTFHGTPADAGYVIGLARATLLAAGFLLGATVDRFRPLRTIPFGFLLMALGAFGTLFSVSYGEMVGSTVLFAAGMGWLSAGLLPLALEGMPLALQGTAVGVFGSFEDFGLLVGPVIISAVYAGYGAHSAFLLVGAVALTGTVLALVALWLRSPLPSATAPARPLEPRSR